MRVLVAGATGFIGTALVRALLQAGHEVTVVTRDPATVSCVFHDSVGAVKWSDAGGLERAVAQVDGVVNLAGASIGAGRWTKRRKEAIVSSRVQTTRALVQAMAGAARRPAVFVNASAVGYYGPHEERVFTEADDPGSDFLARVCVAWENEAQRAAALGVRLVIVRMGVVLAADGGALARMLLPFRLYAGGPLGRGHQWFPWIHRDDVVGIFLHALARPDVRGPLNAVAPDAHTNASFSRALGKALGRPSWLPVPAFVLRLALGEMSDMLLTGQRVEPKRTLASGYEFRFPRLQAALADLFGRH